MLVGHLTDLHALGEGERLAGVLDANMLARKAVDAINYAPLRPKFAVVTGDLTHHGRLNEMSMARRILEGLLVPYFVLPGSHDDTAAFWEVFGDLPYLSGRSGDVSYVIEEFDVRLVVADTTSGSGGMPDFGFGRCTWLQEALSASPERPTLVAMHHPPFPCCIPTKSFLNDPIMEWASGLKEVIARHTQVKLVLCGQVHRSIQRVWAGTLASVGPATCVQSEPRFDTLVSSANTDRRSFSLIAEPPAYQLHWWDGEAFTTYTLPTDKTFPRT